MNLLKTLAVSAAVFTFTTQTDALCIGVGESQALKALKTDTKPFKLAKDGTHVIFSSAQGAVAKLIDKAIKCSTNKKTGEVNFKANTKFWNAIFKSLSTAQKDLFVEWLIANEYNDLFAPIVVATSKTAYKAASAKATANHAAKQESPAEEEYVEEEYVEEESEE